VLLASTSLTVQWGADPWGRRRWACGMLAYQLVAGDLPEDWQVDLLLEKGIFRPPAGLSQVRPPTAPGCGTWECLQGTASPPCTHSWPRRGCGGH
jgi:hypothetical protein